MVNQSSVHVPDGKELLLILQLFRIRWLIVLALQMKTYVQLLTFHMQLDDERSIEIVEDGISLNRAEISISLLSYS